MRPLSLGLIFALVLAAVPAHAFIISYGSSGALTGDHRAYIQELIHQFRTAYPDAEVTIRESASYVKPIIDTVLTAKGEAGGESDADVAVVGLVEWPILFKRNLLRPLSSVLTEGELRSVHKALRPELVRQVYGEGLDARKYALPFNRSYPVLYANIDALRDLKGVSPTWDQLEAALAKANGRLALATEDWVSEYVLFNSSGQSTLLAKGTHFRDSETEATIAFLRKLTEKKLMYTVPDQHTAYLDFLDGKNAATILSVSNYRAVLKRAKFGVQLFMPPHHKNKITILGGGDLILPGSPSRPMSDKTRKDLRHFLLWFYSDKGTAEWAKIVGYFPVTRSALQSASYKATLQARPADRPVFLNQDRWQVHSFYEISEFCNAIKLRALVENTVRETLTNFDPPMVLKQADDYARNVIEKTPCP